MFSLKGHTAIVTGGASGIGLATVRMLAGLGADIVIADLNEEAGTETVAGLVAEGRNATFVRTNVAEAGDVDALIGITAEKHGSLEILMHFAGIGMELSALDTTPADWERIIGVNLTGTFLMMQAAGRVMVEKGYGRIVAMSSMAGIRGGTGRSAYGRLQGRCCRDDAGHVHGMGRSRRHGECAGAGGAIETALVKKMHDDETRRAYLAGIPMDRYGTPEEVAAAAVFLALPQSSYITGVTLPVDGGFDASGVIKR